MNTAIEPQPVEDAHGDGRWMSMHNRFLSDAKEKEPEVLFVGDSLIQHLQFSEIWNKIFVPLHCLNFGMGGDQTQHLLWRLQNGELENLSPKVIVLLIGTNNHGNTAEEVVGGILEIVKYINAKQPQAHLFVMGLPPRGEKPNPLREKFSSINQALVDQLDNIENTTFLNVEQSLFVHEQDSTISPTDMYDFLHFTEKGYRKLMEPVAEEVQNTLKNFLTADELSCGDVDN